MLTVHEAQTNLDAARKAAKAARDAIVAGDETITGTDLAAADADAERAALLLESAKRAEHERKIAEADARAAAIVEAVANGVTIEGAGPGAGASHEHIDQLRLDVKRAVQALYGAVAEHDRHVASLIQSAESVAGPARDAGLTWRGTRAYGGGMTPGPATIRCRGGSLVEIGADNVIGAAVLDGVQSAANLAGVRNLAPVWRELEAKSRAYAKALAAAS